jgi:hypothetical protein
MVVIAWEATVAKKKSKAAGQHPFAYRSMADRGTVAAGVGSASWWSRRCIRESGGYRRRQTVVPFIRMSGVWLEELGFDRGDRIESPRSVSGSC